MFSSRVMVQKGWRTYELKEWEEDGNHFRLVERGRSYSIWIPFSELDLRWLCDNLEEPSRKQSKGVFFRLGVRVGTTVDVICKENDRGAFALVKWSKAGRARSLLILEWVKGEGWLDLVATFRRFGKIERGGYNSFAEVAQVEEWPSSQVIVTEARNRLWELEVDVNSSEKRIEMMKRSLIGKIQPTHCSQVKKETVQEWVQKSWKDIFPVKIWEYGDNLFIFQFSSVADARRIVNRRNWSINGNFMTVKWWKEEEGAKVVSQTNSRFWVRVVGMPFLLWDDAVFKEVALRFGTFVGFDDSKKDEDGFRWRRVMIQGSFLQGIKVVQIKMSNTIFSVYVWPEGWPAVNAEAVSRAGSQGKSPVRRRWMQNWRSQVRTDGHIKHTAANRKGNHFFKLRVASGIRRSYGSSGLKHSTKHGPFFKPTKVSFSSKGPTDSGLRNITHH